jgi:peptidoglycan/LPS O-acetylase OafA/YrhL
MYAATVGHLKLASSKVLLFLGAVSYPLYLLHEYLSYTFMIHAEAMGVPSMAAVLIAMSGSVLLAYLVHKKAEEPAMAWIRRSYRKRKEPGNLKWWRAGLVSVFALLALGTRLISSS